MKKLQKYLNRDILICYFLPIALAFIAGITLAFTLQY
jgi:hypothetical protein